MNILLGVVLAGESKNYCLPKFLEQAEKLFYDHSDLDVMYAVDYPRLDIPYDKQFQVPQMAGLTWATEIVWYGKKCLNYLALNEKDVHGEPKYDAIIWQGIDCFYDSREDFELLIETARNTQSPIVGALVAGRNRPDYPVCRVFRHNRSGGCTRRQEEIKPSIFEERRPIPVPGYIGSDATLIKREALEAVTWKGYQHWHERPNKDTPLAELGPEEWFMWEAVAHHRMIPVCHTGIRPWHAHESGRTVRYPDQECNINDLTFLS